jgi:TorA maturation chaperone TorD
MGNNNQREPDWTSILTGEILLFSLVGKFLYLFPEEDWLQAFIDEDVFKESPFGEDQTDIISGLELMRNWCNQNQDGFHDDTITDLKVDYTRLFIGSKELIAPPYESGYLSEPPQEFQEQTLQVRSWYRRYDLEPKKFYKEPDDHIGLETTFIAHLAQLGLAALEVEDTERFQSILDAQRGFLNDHLLIWGPHWCGLVIKNAQTDFYKGAALLLRGAFTKLKEIFDLEISR